MGCPVVRAFGCAIEQYHVDMFFFRLNDVFSKKEHSSYNLSSYTLLAARGFASIIIQFDKFYRLGQVLCLFRPPSHSVQF